MIDTARAVAFLDRVIGAPYEPEGLHCWELARRCQLEVFDRDLPVIMTVPETKREIVTLMARRHEYPGWKELQAPVHGAIVFMTRHGNGPSRSAIHAGVYLALDGGAVLHTDDPHGVTFESLLELTTRNWADMSFYSPT